MSKCRIKGYVVDKLFVLRRWFQTEDSPTDGKEIGELFNTRNLRRIGKLFTFDSQEISNQRV